MSDVFRLYIAEYETCETWLYGGRSAILSYIKPFDQYIVYITGRSKLPFDNYKHILESMGDQCVFVDARQMADADMHEHMLAQVYKYANEYTHIYFLCNQEDYKALRGRINIGIEVSFRQNFRTGKIEIPSINKLKEETNKLKEENENEQVAHKTEKEISADAVSNSFEDIKEKAPEDSKKELSSSDIQDIPVREQSSEQETNETIPDKSQEEKKPEERPSPKNNKNNKAKKRKHKENNGAGNNISDVPMNAFMSMFGGKIGDDAQRAPRSTPTPYKEKEQKKTEVKGPEIQSEKKEESGSVIKDETPAADNKPKKRQRFLQPRDVKEDSVKGSEKELNSSAETKEKEKATEEDWVKRISGDNQKPLQNSSKIQDIEKAIFGTKQAAFTIDKQYTALDDSKAKTVSLLADRLIRDIKLLIKGIDKYDFDFDAYMELISTLIRSDDLNDFREGWSIVHPGCDLNMSEKIYAALYKEACHYARTCEVLYSEDYW